jgi:citrate lyase beta subunit
MADTSIPDAPLMALLDLVDKANVPSGGRLSAALDRQPVHTVYGGAHLFKSDTVPKLGAIALRALQEHASDSLALAEAFGFDRQLAARIYPRIVDKLTREPIEDYRIDFEDGFGSRPDEEEDRVARAAADQVAAGMSTGTLAPGMGIRVKALTEDLKRRSLRTFDLFLTRLLDRTDGALPPEFVVTLPKITAPEQVAALASACDAFEYWRELPAGTLRIELMIETPQAIVAPDGRVALPALVRHGHGRVAGVHFGPYDYTAQCNITAAHQDIRHPACDFARHVIQVAFAGTAIRLSDGPTTIMPIGPHRAPSGGSLDAAQQAENTQSVRRAWQLHEANVRHALVNGFYQGWDLHPAQLPARYAALYAFFLEGLEPAAERLRHFVAQAAQATTVRGVFDDAATGQGLLNYFLRATSCGAITEEEAVAMSGLSLQQLRSRSFAAAVGGHDRR